MAIVCGLAFVAAGCAARNSTITGPSASGKYGSGIKFGSDATAAPNSTKTKPTTHVLFGGSAGSNSQAAATFKPRSMPDTSSIDDDADLGRNAHLYLSAKVPRLLIEIDAVSGDGPDSAATNTLAARLRSVADKPRGVVFAPTGKIAQGHDTWTVEQLHSAELQSSHHRSSSGEIVLHILYVNGQFDGASDALGVAFKASTVAMFKERISNAATPLVSPADIETAALVHEIGHVLSLVNIGYHSPRDHEDPQHRGHSSNRQSVMYYAVDNVGVTNLLGGSTKPPTDFDADDRADLRDVKNGKLP